MGSNINYAVQRATLGQVALAAVVLAAILFMPALIKGQWADCLLVERSFAVDYGGLLYLEATGGSITLGPAARP